MLWIRPGDVTLDPRAYPVKKKHVSPRYYAVGSGTITPTSAPESGGTRVTLSAAILTNLSLARCRFAFYNTTDASGEVRPAPTQHLHPQIATSRRPSQHAPQKPHHPNHTSLTTALKKAFLCCQGGASALRCVERPHNSSASTPASTTAHKLSEPLTNSANPVHETEGGVSARRGVERQCTQLERSHTSLDNCAQFTATSPGIIPTRASPVSYTHSEPRTQTRIARAQAVQAPIIVSSDRVPNSSAIESPDGGLVNAKLVRYMYTPIILDVRFPRLEADVMQAPSTLAGARLASSKRRRLYGRSAHPQRRELHGTCVLNF